MRKVEKKTHIKFNDDQTNVSGLKSGEPFLGVGSTGEGRVE